MFSLGKLYTEQMFVLLSMQLRNDADTQTVKRCKGLKSHVIHCTYNIKLGIYKCVRMRFHSANWLVVLHICAP